ncbi:hypothetical protein V6N13_073382 [Hibiscus sabdariffa]|uniref:Uncharacterized protein n=2 Tax=Hibiscus sabdariffa TaxID=183260 RepID=A0ABR2BF02_9ROSI
MALQITKASPASASPSDGSKGFFSTPLPNLKLKKISRVDEFPYFIHIEENQEIKDVRLPDINIYKPSTSFFKSLKCLLNPLKKHKELVRLTRFYQHPIPSGAQPRFITLNIPADFASQAYAHVHVGAIRLALTFHNKKGLPVATRIALLDSRYKNYQHACLGMVETTLNSGTAVFTVFPNFTLSLKEKTWSTTFVAQIQMIGAPMEPGLVQATLHSQMAYRLQDHVYGLGKASHADIPLVQVQPNEITITTIHIPASISRQELVAVLPEAWVSNYENRRTKEQTDRNTSALIRNASGTVSSLRLLPQN